MSGKITLSTKNTSVTMDIPETKFMHWDVEKNDYTIFEQTFSGITMRIDTSIGNGDPNQINFKGADLVKAGIITAENKAFDY